MSLNVKADYRFRSNTRSSPSASRATTTSSACGAASRCAPSPATPRPCPTPPRPASCPASPTPSRGAPGGRRRTSIHDGRPEQLLRPHAPDRHGAEHERGRRASSSTRRLHRHHAPQQRQRQGGTLAHRTVTRCGLSPTAAPAGFSTARERDCFPKFIQNGGPDFTNPANYRPRHGRPRAARNKTTSS
jgi:hypothetical protein